MPTTVKTSTCPKPLDELKYSIGTVTDIVVIDPRSNVSVVVVAVAIFLVVVSIYPGSNDFVEVIDNGATEVGEGVWRVGTGPSVTVVEGRFGMAKRTTVGSLATMLRFCSGIDNAWDTRY